MENIKTFPAFQPISISDLDWYNEFYKQFLPYADHYFGNLLAWLNFNDDLQISQLYGNVVFQYTDVFSEVRQCCSYTILGNKEPVKTLDTFYKQNPSINPVLQMIPEEFTSNIMSEDYEIADDRDSWDYIINMNTLLKMEGADYQRLRYSLNHFEKHNGVESVFEEIDVSNIVSQKLLFASYRQWLGGIEHGNDPEAIETHALQIRFDNYKSVPFRAFVMKIKNNIEGFLIFSYAPQKEYVIAHHLKCSYKYDYLFDVILIKASQIFQKDGKTLLNLEQDLGKPGLRKHKELLRPERFLKKYTVSLKKANHE